MQKTRLDKSNGSPRGPSEVISRYLEAIYYMWSEGEQLRPARLADWLGVTRPTVTVALRRMNRDGMVTMNRAKEIQLTARGRAAAELIVRRHRIMERWLTDALGLDWVTADQEAARLEHAISDVVERRLYEALGKPRTCPHGNPIPGHSRPVPREVRLARMTAGSRAQITRVSEVAEREAPRLLSYLHDRGLVPGSRLHVVEVDDVGRTMRVRAGDRELTLSYETASKLWTLPARS